MNDLDGKVGIVTGGGRGIGRAEALRLASDGAADLTGQILAFAGRRLQSYRNWSPVASVDAQDLWTYEALDKARSALFAG